MVQPIQNPCDIEAPTPCTENPSFTYTRYPCDYDDPRPGNTRGLPVIVDLQTPVRAEVVNRHREAVLAIESELGIQPSGTFTTVRSRLDAFDSLLCSVWQSILTSGNPINVQHNGSIIVNPVTSLNFIGDNVSISQVDSTQANITIYTSDGYRQIHEDLPVTYSGQTVFTLSDSPWDSSLLLFIDGLKQEMADYTVTDNQLLWAGTQTLNTSDVVEVLYSVESLSSGSGSGSGFSPSEEYNRRGIVTETAFARSTLATDENKLVICSHASGCSVTIQPDSSEFIPIGGTIYWMATQTSQQVTLVPGLGVTINTNATLSSRTHYSVIWALHIAANEWVIGGDIDP